MDKITGVILDWAGTAVDFGCFAPLRAFLMAFKEHGVPITVEEARGPMGMLKKDHIKTLLALPRVKAAWREAHGNTPGSADIENLYRSFEPLLLESLSEYTQPLPGLLKTVDKLRTHGIKIGSTTGYTSSMMDTVIRGAAQHGYIPDSLVTPDVTDGFGRPWPYMIFKNMQNLNLAQTVSVVKVGDTLSDIKEAMNAGAWSVGVLVGSSELGLSFNEYENLPSLKRQKALEDTAAKFINCGADFVIESINDLPSLIEEINHLLASNTCRRPNQPREKIFRAC